MKLVPGAGLAKPPRMAMCLALLYSSLIVAVASDPVAKNPTGVKHNADKEHAATFTGGLYEYRSLGTGLVGLWREYISMSEALSHALRDYNVALRQEQRDELVRVLAHKHQEAEVTLSEQKGKSSSSVFFGELASLKELKRQMKRLDKKIGKIPDYKHPEENVLLVQWATTPVSVSKALSHSTATLFHKAVSSYHLHIEQFTKKYNTLRSFLEGIKAHSEGGSRHNLIKQEAELGNFYDTEAPISLHVPNKK